MLTLDQSGVLAFDQYQATRLTVIRADVSSVTFQGAFATAMQNDPTITASTPMYAAFLSGLDQTFVPMQITQNNADYKIDKIPAMDAGQVYVVLTRSATLANAENRITGPAILQVSLLDQIRDESLLIVGPDLPEGHGSSWVATPMFVEDGILSFFWVCISASR